MRFDLAAYGKDGNLAILGEAKVRFSADPLWARELRHNILARGPILRPRFFVVAVPDRLFLWGGDAPPDAEPTEIDARQTFAPYYRLLGIKPDEIQGSTFENLVSWWLSDLTHADPADADPALRQSGMVDAVVGGRISRELAA